MRSRAWMCRVFSRFAAVAAMLACVALHVRAETPSELYLGLRECTLDSAQVYKIRGAALDREDLHIRLDDGIIGFVRAVDGHITAAYFEGDGEAYLSPPDRVERWSLNVFTGSAILEERFVSGFLRFNDDTFNELKPFFRTLEQAEIDEFVAKWQNPTRVFCATAAQRTATTILNSQRRQPDGTILYQRDPADRLLIARAFSERSGLFDVVFDTTQPEQISVGRYAQTLEADMYDTWTSFPMRSARQAAAGTSQREVINTQASAERAAPDPINISDYKLKVRVRPPTAIDVEADLNLVVREGGERVVRFELSRHLVVREVSSQGRKLEFLQNEALQGSELARRGNDLVAVVFPEPLMTGQRVPLNISYSGEVMSDAGGGLVYVGARGTWYPNRGVVFANFEMEFWYPPDWTLVASGKRLSQVQAQGEVVAKYVSERPIALAGFNLGRYITASAKTGKTVIEVYATKGVESALPQRNTLVLVPDPKNPGKHEQITVAPDRPSPARNAQIIAARAAQDIAFFSERLGPYPYGSLALTQMPGSLSQSWPSMIYLSSLVFLAPEERAALRVDSWNELLFGKVMQTHEAVHQWVGDIILWQSYREQWIIEALANYCALLKLESENPEDFQTALENYRTALLAKNADGVEVTDAGPVTLGVRLNSSRFPDGYGVISYGRGTWLFHMLRQMLLDNPEAQARRIGPGVNEPFFVVLRKLRQRFEGKAITTRDVQQAFEEELPDSIRYEGRKSLDWFFDTWVNGTSIPKFELESVKFTTVGGETRVTGKITQKHAAESLVTSVPIYTAGPTQTLLGRVFVDGPETTFRFTVPAGTKKILLDPNGTLLTRP